MVEDHSVNSKIGVSADSPQEKLYFEMENLSSCVSQEEPLGENSSQHSVSGNTDLCPNAHEEQLLSGTGKDLQPTTSERASRLSAAGARERDSSECSFTEKPPPTSATTDNSDKHPSDSSHPSNQETSDPAHQSDQNLSDSSHPSDQETSDSAHDSDQEPSHPHGQDDEKPLIHLTPLIKKPLIHLTPLIKNSDPTPLIKNFLIHPHGQYDIQASSERGGEESR